MLGTIVAGSLIEGLTLRISPDAHLEHIKTGKFVSIVGHQYTFFSLITDLQLQVTMPEILQFPPQHDEQLLHDMLQRKFMYTTAQVKPMLMLDTHNQPQPVKTIPPHFAPVYEAREQDVRHIFGEDSGTTSQYFTVGKPLDMDVPVCIDLDRFAERSNGIFGKTGTGKTFITRILLSGLLQRGHATTVIFDMHSEYGLQARTEGGSGFVKGLKTLFGSRVAIFSLDPESTRRRGGSADIAMTLSYQSVHVNDIISLHQELNLHATACEAASLLAAKYKKDWLKQLLAHSNDLKELADQVGAHPESIAALHRKLKPLEYYPFFTNTPQTDVIDNMISYIDRGISIIIEFGKYTSAFCYLLMANIITRRIHERYIEKTEAFLGSHRPEDEPQQLMIVIEEAHKFLNPQAAQQTPFGTIAREMRKYYVSLLIVDQRPSGIDPEVLSQIGTKIIAQLNDEKDINAALTGAAHASQLRAVLSGLETKKQTLLIGHAVPMPVVVETRSYDEQFYRDMAPTYAQTAQADQDIFGA